MQPLITSPQALLEDRKVKACCPTEGKVILVSVDKTERSLEILEVKKELDRLSIVNVVRACEEPVVITAIEFIYNVNIKCYFICAGFSNGGVTLYSMKGLSCLSFNLCPQTPVVSFCTDQHRCLVLYAENQVAIVGHETLAESMTAADGNFRFRLYNLEGRTETLEIASVLLQGNLTDVFDVQVQGTRQWGILAVGDPVITLHVVDDENFSLRHLAGGAVRGVLNFARGFLVGKQDNNQARRPIAIGRTLEFRDPQRRGISLSLSKIKNEFLVTDAFGRVTLFCRETLRCLWMWKGYRDAQVATTEHGILIYAPRRGLLEFWIDGTRTRAWLVKNGTVVPVSGVAGPEALFMYEDGHIEQISDMLDDVESFGSCESLHQAALDVDETMKPPADIEKMPFVSVSSKIVLSSKSPEELWNPQLLHRYVDQTTEKEPAIAQLLRLHLKHNGELVNEKDGLRPSNVLLGVLQKYDEIGSTEFQTKVLDEVTLLSLYVMLAEAEPADRDFETSGSSTWEQYLSSHLPDSFATTERDFLAEFMEWIREQSEALRGQQLDELPIAMWEVCDLKNDLSKEQTPPYSRFVRDMLDMDVLMWIGRQSLLLSEANVFEHTLETLGWGDWRTLFLDFFFSCPLDFLLSQKVSLKGEGDLWERRASGSRSVLMRLCAHVAEEEHLIEVALGSGSIPHACLLSLILSSLNEKYQIWAESLVARCLPLTSNVPLLSANRVALCLPALMAMSDVPWTEEFLKDGIIKTSFGADVELSYGLRGRGKLVVSTFAVLFGLWDYLRGVGDDRLVACLDAMNEMESSPERSALSYLVFHHCFLRSVEEWQAVGLNNPGKLDYKHINSAMFLLQVAASLPLIDSQYATGRSNENSGSAEDAAASSSYGLGHLVAGVSAGIVDVVSGVGLKEDTGKKEKKNIALAQGAVAEEAEMESSTSLEDGPIVEESILALWTLVDQNRSILAEAAITLRMLLMIAESKVSWDILALGPLSNLPVVFPLPSPKRGQKMSVAMDMEEQRRQFLQQVATECSEDEFRRIGGFKLVKDLNFQDEVYAEVVAAKVYEGKDADIESVLSSTKMVLDPLKARVAAVLNELCIDSSPYRATILCSVSPEDLDKFLYQTPIDARATAFVDKVGVTRALQSTLTLCAHPVLQGDVEIIEIAKHAKDILDLLEDG